MNNSESHTKRWNIRAIVSLFLTLQFALLAVSGFLLYAAPRCSDAEWMGWHVWGLSKEQWEAMHLFFGMTFPLIAIIHLLYNYQAWVSYLRRQASEVRCRARELSVSVALCAAMVICVVGGYFPVNVIVEHGEMIKEWHAQAVTPPPWFGAGEATLTSLAKEIHVPVETAIHRLSDFGHVATDADTLAALAERDGTSMMALYRIILGPQATSQPAHSGRGGCGGGKRRTSGTCTSSQDKPQ
jgi:hypothetical protein